MRALSSDPFTKVVKSAPRRHYWSASAIAVLAAVSAVVLPAAHAQLVTIGPAPGTPASYGPGTGGSIPDNTPAGLTSTINLSQSGLVTALNSVTITGFTHTWIGDLTATINHAGQSATLFARPGGAGNNGDPNGTYTFSTSSTTAFATTSGANPAPGTYAPLGSFSSFAGLALAGDWSLNIADNAAADTGSFTGWSFNASSSTSVNGYGGAIPDNSPTGFSSQLVVAPNTYGSIQSFNNVTIRGLQHTYVGDLKATITHVETGTTVDLFARPGVTTSDPNGFPSNFNGDYIFSVGGADLLTAAANGNTSYNIPAGTYAPSTSQVPGQANANTFASFAGQDAAGTWLLNIIDSNSGFTGSFGSWSFGFVPNADTPEPGSLALVLCGGSGPLVFAVARVRKRRRAAAKSAS